MPKYTHSQLKSNKNTLQGKDAFAMYKALLFTAAQLGFAFLGPTVSDWTEYFPRTCQGLLCWSGVGCFVIFSLERKKNNLKMKGWSSGKKPTVQKKTMKSQILRAFLKLHPLTATIWQLCKLFTLTVYMYIFWGKILFSAKRTHRSVAMLQMDLVLLTLCDSPVFGVCFLSHFDRLGWCFPCQLPSSRRAFLCLFWKYH